MLGDQVQSETGHDSCFAVLVVEPPQVRFGGNVCVFSVIPPVIHPLELLQRWRQRLPWASLWSQAVPGPAVAPEQDWLQEPATLEEAQALFPHLSEEEALLRYQRFRLGMRWNRQG